MSNVTFNGVRSSIKKGFSRVNINDFCLWKPMINKLFSRFEQIFELCTDCNTQRVFSIGNSEIYEFYV